MGTEIKYIIVITNIVFAILFFVVLNSKIYAVANDLSFDQKFFARDIAYTIDAMCSVDGYVEVGYVINEDLDIQIKNGLVIVSYKQAKEKYPYIQDSECNFKYTRDTYDLLIEKVEVKK
jgi:hypothetical protein